MTLRLTAGSADEDLDQRLSDELDGFNSAAVSGPGVVELTVRCNDADGSLVGGISGWTWQEAAGIAMTWVHNAQRATGLGSRLVSEFERIALTRGVKRVFVTSFTFQAPGFYERAGYHEIFRWDGVPTAGHADVHLRKDLEPLSS